MDDDEAMWNEVNGMNDNMPAGEGGSKPNSKATASDGMDEDEEMWDIVREMEQGESTDVAAIGPPKPSPPPGHSGSDAAVDNDEDDWESMYV